MSPPPSATNIAVNQPAGLLRRLGALLYDSLLLFGVLFFATLVLLVIRRGVAIPPGDPGYFFYLVTVSFLFCGWFWTRGGQTLGMRAWRIRVQQRDGTALGWGRALWRFLLAWLALLPLGAGYFWMLIDRDGLTWHDRGSRTVVVCTDR